MPDLTLNEYRDISEDALKHLIIEEERKMSGAACHEKGAVKKASCLTFFLLLRDILNRGLHSLTLH